MQCFTFITKVGITTYTQKQSFLLEYQTTPQLPGSEGIGGNGSIHFIFISSHVYQIHCGHQMKLFRHTFYLHWFEGNFNKTWQKGIYFKSNITNSPRTITHTTQSVSHVMDIVILTCGTFLFFHHLWINWVVEGMAREKGGIWNVWWLPLLLVSSEHFEVRLILT